MASGNRVLHYVRLLAAVLIVVNSLARPVAATDRYYPNQSATSPDGRYRLDTVSPENAGPQRRAFADQFTYTLTEVPSGQVLWTRTQPRNEGSPVRLFVHHQTWVVISTAWDHLLVLKPLTGETALDYPVFDAMPKNEKERFVHQTTAGPMWTGRSRWSFLEHDDRVYFVIRAWWDRRIIIDLDAGKVLTEIDPKLAAACDASDRDYVIKTLGTVDELMRGDDESGQRFWTLQTAVHIAGRLGVAETVPLLRKVEQSGDVGSSGGWFDTKKQFKDGDINPFNLSELSLRRAAQLALRRLGEKPAELPCTMFRYTREGKLGEYVEPPPLPAPRADRVALVQAGMQAGAVLESIGPPDYVIFGRTPSWEYDMDAATPFTFRVLWKDQKTVDRVERLTPPLWQQGETRYEQID